VKTFVQLIVVFVVFLVIGCASGISKQARSQVTISDSFKVLLADPDKYMGETVLLGGKILETLATSDSSEITVLELSLSQQGRLADGVKSQGRYLVRSDQFLDPAIYKKDTLLTVVGKINGKEDRKIGDFDYLYPIVEKIEIKLWPPGYQPAPRFHFGFGIGKTF
jgi:outer membrane lipoprotein